MFKKKVVIPIQGDILFENSHTTIRSALIWGIATFISFSLFRGLEDGTRYMYLVFGIFGSLILLYILLERLFVKFFPEHYKGYYFEDKIVFEAKTSGKQTLEFKDVAYFLNEKGKIRVILRDTFEKKASAKGWGLPAFFDDLELSSKYEKSKSEVVGLLNDKVQAAKSHRVSKNDTQTVTKR